MQHAQTQGTEIARSTLSKYLWAWDSKWNIWDCLGFLLVFFPLWHYFSKRKRTKKKQEEKAQILFCLNINADFPKKEKKQERRVRGIDTLRENFISRELTFQRKQIKLSFSSFTSAVTSLKFTLYTSMLSFVFITLKQN